MVCEPHRWFEGHTTDHLFFSAHSRCSAHLGDRNRLLVPSVLDISQADSHTAPQWRIARYSLAAQLPRAVHYSASFETIGSVSAHSRCSAHLADLVRLLVPSVLVISHTYSNTNPRWRIARHSLAALRCPERHTRDHLVCFSSFKVQCPSGGPAPAAGTVGSCHLTHLFTHGPAVAHSSI